MRILYIDEENRINSIIAEYLTSCGYELEHMEAPGDKDDVTYMSIFSGKLASFAPDYVFSTVFYPFLSLACGVSNLRYVVWIMPGYEETNYSFQIKNDRDRIYVADKAMYEFYIRLGLSGVQYLPISYAVLRETELTDNDIKGESSVYDVSVISPCTFQPVSLGDIMPILRDSTKGYLDGYIEAKKSELNLDGMFCKLAEYAQEDIMDRYPMSEDSYESPAIKYDNRILYPHIDRSYGIYYSLFLISLKDIDKLALYTPNGLPYYNEKMDVIDCGAVDDICDCIRPTKLTVCLPPLQDGSELPAYVYDLICKGYAVIMPDTLDKEIADALCIPTFRNSNAYMKVIRRYLNSEEELEGLRNKQYEALKRYKMCSDPVTVLFGQG